MLPSFCRKAVTVERAPLVDSRGTLVRDWSAAVPHEIAGCSVQPATGGTAWADIRQGVTVRAVLYAPPGSDIQVGDRIVYEGRRYSIEGAPLPWESPTGRVSHIECALIDWEG